MFYLSKVGMAEITDVNSDILKISIVRATSEAIALQRFLAKYPDRKVTKIVRS